VIRTSVTLVVGVALLAGCGSGGGSGNSTTLTPTAYRAKMNGLCAHAKDSLGRFTPNTLGVFDKAKMKEALNAFQPIVTAMEGVKPPASLASAHAKLVDSLKTLMAAVRTMSTLKPGKANSTAAMSALGSLMTAAAGLQTSLGTLHLTTCSKLIRGH
jgi:hypothetical protein